MDAKRYIARNKKIIDKSLGRYLPSAKTRPDLIHKAMRYAVFPGGKRIRPVITIASFEICGGKGNKILPVACAMELIHTYTLIHDDLPCMDNDDYRRGKPSCHKKFDEATALLAGDGLLTLGFQLLGEAGNSDIVNEVAKAIGSMGTIGGQVADIIPGKKDLDYITSRKTGMLFETAARAGAIFKNVDSKYLNAVGNFAKYIGFTFQLIDDLLDRDGYVRAYGETHTRKMAGLLTDRAKGSLGVFGKKAARLSGIADLILERSS